MCTRRRTVRSFLLPLVLIAGTGCSSDEGGLGKPTVDAGPVADITFVFSNPGTEDIYIEWSTAQPQFVLKHNDTTMLTRRGCLPFCGDGCNCSPCSPTLTKVKRVPPGESVSVLWKPVHYTVNTCGSSTKCTCIESWPVTIGDYDVSIVGMTDATGEVSPDDPDLLIGAEASADSRSCFAHKTFALEGGQTVTANLFCP